MARHAFYSDESGVWGASRYETGCRTRGVHTMRWQGWASLPLRQQGHTCVPNYSASKDASPDTSGTTAFVRSNRTRGRTGEASVHR